MIARQLAVGAVAGDVLHPPRVLAVGERDAEPAGRALRRGDAGHHLDRDAALRQAAISSPARPKIIGSPPLSRTTRLPACASRPSAR